MRRPNILYTTYGGMFRLSGYSEQCRSEIAQLSARGYGVILLAYENYAEIRKSGEGRRELGRYCAKSGVKLRIVPIMAESRSSMRRLRGLLDRAAMRIASRIYRADILHAHVPYLAWVAADVGRTQGKPSIADLHGVGLHEYLYAGGKKSDEEYRWRSICEKRAVEDCSAVFVVSSPFKDYLGESYPIDKQKIFITRSSVDVKSFDFQPKRREGIRNSLSLQDRPVLLFVGSVQGYHVFGEVISFFKALLQVRQDAYLLVLTTGVEDSRQALSKAGLEGSFHVDRVGHDEVPGWMSAADMGILLREPSMVNRAASPVKLAEYLACGLPVAISEGIGDLSSFVADHDLGAVIRKLNADEYREAARELLSQWPDTYTVQRRKRCRDFAVAELSWDKCMSVFEQAYRELAPDTFED